MAAIRVDRYCGVPRKLSAFVFRDWWSVRQRYEYDLRELCKFVRKGELTPPEDDLPSREGSECPPECE
jgi:hypothetical protein